MSEPLFHRDELVLNPHQDPMGNDAHQGLERFLKKLHQPGVPSHTIITDPDFYVFLWFHDANGRLIDCPYVTKEYKTFLEESSVQFGKANPQFYDREGI